MRNPLRVKGDLARSNILLVSELLEYGLITTYDPTIGKRGGSYYLTPIGSRVIWQNQPH